MSAIGREVGLKEGMTLGLYHPDYDVDGEPDVTLEVEKANEGNSSAKVVNGTLEEVEKGWKVIELS